MEQTLLYCLPDRERRRNDEMAKKMERNPNRELLAKGLAGWLADCYLLYNRTQLYHWNVEGPQFHALHQQFEGQYRALGEAVDTIAERIRTLGYYTPGSLRELLQMSRLDQERVARDSQDMLLHLIEGHQQVVHRARELRPLAEDACDDATDDLLIERIREQEKMVWMLKSQAAEGSKEMTFARRPLKVAT